MKGLSSQSLETESSDGRSSAGPQKYTKKELNKVIRAQLGFDGSDLYTDKEMSCSGMAQRLNLKTDDEIQKALKDRTEQVNM